MKLLKRYLVILVLIFNVPVALAAGAETSTGTVAESMQSGGYVYIKLNEDDMWIATSPLPRPISVGDKIEYSGGMEMRDFYSKTLDRKFPTIFFIQNVKLAGRSADAMHAADMKTVGDDAMTISTPVMANSPQTGEIASLADGKTVADIFANSAELNEQTVRLNARFIKVSKNIVGKNWITLQDGTGTEPDNQLLVTSLELAEPGDTVVAKGVVRTDIDIGSGYKYKVLMQEVTFSPGVE